MSPYWCVKNITVFFVLFLSQLSFAQYQSLQERGRETKTYSSPDNQVQEECVLPKPMLNANYLKKDAETEEGLCAMDLYQGGDFAMCPKLFSTSPGIELYNKLPEGMDRAKYEATYCKQPKKRPGKKIAKYKQSITCSYTPSLISYYHLSRYFNMEFVPPSVIRTMSTREHEKVTAIAKPLAIKLFKDPKTAVRQAWEFLWPQAYKDTPATLFNQSGDQIYGALSINPTKEFYYGEVNGNVVGKYKIRYEIFKQQPPYRNLSSSKLVAQDVGTSLEKSAQRVVQMKDVSDMIVLDTILNQADRIGNIHMRAKWLYLEDGKLKDKWVDYAKKSDKKLIDPEQLAEMKAKNAVQIKQMLLKDNDCGVAKSNNARKYALLEGVGHMSLVTYQRLQQLQKDFKTAEMQSYFQQELLFTGDDIKSVGANIDFAADYSRKKCKEAKLILDLDLDRHIAGANTDLHSTDFCD